MTTPTSRMAKKRALQRAGLVYVAGWVRAEDEGRVLKIIAKVNPEVEAALSPIVFPVAPLSPVT